MKIQSTSYQRIVGKTLTKGTLISFFLVCMLHAEKYIFQKSPVVDMKISFHTFHYPIACIFCLLCKFL